MRIIFKNFIKYHKYFFIFVLILLVYQFSRFNEDVYQSNKTLLDKNINYSNHLWETLEQKADNYVQIINLSKPFHSDIIYTQISCRKSAKIIVTTTLCVHETSKDIHVSGSVWKYGIWEGHIVEKYLKFLLKDKNSFAIDIGSQIGIFTLFAAKLGRDVLSIEPFYENIMRLHKAAKIEKLTHRITLLANAVSNKANETKLLTYEIDNIGGQSLFIFKNKKLDSSVNKKYLVRTITLDDLVDYLPRRSDGLKYEKAVLKIDIEGFELYVFEKASKLFETIEIGAIFMEWGNMPKLIDHIDKVNKLIDFFTSRNYVPYKINKPMSQNQLINFFVDLFRSENELPIRYWENWSWDIVWIKK